MIIHLILGTALGTTTGLVPGLHTNNVSPLIVALPLVNPNLTIFLASAAASFTVSSHIPSVILGTPTGEDLSALPGHMLTKKGKSITAINHTIKGSLIAAAMFPLIATMFLIFTRKLYDPLSFLLPYLLISATALNIRNIYSFLIAVLSALLGLIALEGSTIMPMLTGFFGISTLILSINRGQLEKQETKVKANTESWKTTRSATLSTALSTIFGAIPAVSTAITATIGRYMGKMNGEEYLSFTGACNTTYVLISFLTLITIGKTRSGATAALSGTLFYTDTLAVVTAVTTSTAISYIVIKSNLSKIARALNLLNYRYLTICSLIILLTLNIALTNLKGIIVLITSTSIGLIAIKTKARRINCMSSLTISTALLLL